jgi:recombination protein RecA
VWETRIAGIENVERFAAALPMWGPRGRVLEELLADPALAKHRGSQRGYLRAVRGELVLEYLREHDVSPALAGSLAGLATEPRGGLRQVIGTSRPRRDRIQALADALDSDFLRSELEEQVWYDRVAEILPAEWRPVYDIEVEEHHTFVANDVVVSNCAPPFKQAEFDIMFNEGFSRTGILVDLGEEHGIVQRAGAWYSYGDDVRLGQGRENAKVFLTENPDVADEIELKLRQTLGMLPTDEETAEAADVEEGAA